MEDGLFEQITILSNKFVDPSNTWSFKKEAFLHVRKFDVFVTFVICNQIEDANKHFHLLFKRKFSLSRKKSDDDQHTCLPRNIF